jgi:dolichol kinase
MKNRGITNNVAIYYNRKIIHIFAGGLCALVVPFLFTTPIYPFIMAILLTLLTYIPHKLNRLMYWFQTEKNMYEVTFTMMWGIILTLGWILYEGDFRLGVIPILFMSVGDALTGIVRNYLYGKRTKSWWGNLAMAAVSIPIGALLGIAGILAGGLASIIEHFEVYPLDDNITVPLTSFTILVLAKFLAPSLLTF